jgi:hypothetical protein
MHFPSLTINLKLNEDDFLPRPVVIDAVTVILYVSASLISKELQEIYPSFVQSSRLLNVGVNSLILEFAGLTEIE